MREKYLWLAVVVLTALTLGQACYIYECNVSAKEFGEQAPVRPEIYKKLHAEKASDAQWEEFEKWRDRIRNQVSRGGPLLERDFDVFFGDRFFAGRPEPFAEIERVRRKMSEQLGGEEKAIFENYWEKWFEQRMRMAQFKTGVVRSGENVTLTIQVPGLAGGTADVDITGDRIKISFRAEIFSEEKSGGGIIRREPARGYVKILPLPAEAEAGTGKVEIGAESVKITFARKKDGR
ncbi:MAG TPA: hypothetical protein DCS63_03785 [Elusimicrobia bacterium]|nr:hypothetical protein [Elusimicrobiota bacterium]